MRCTSVRGPETPQIAPAPTEMTLTSHWKSEHGATRGFCSPRNSHEPPTSSRGPSGWLRWAKARMLCSSCSTTAPRRDKAWAGLAGLGLLISGGTWCQVCSAETSSCTLPTPLCSQTPSLGWRGRLAHGPGHGAVLQQQTNSLPGQLQQAPARAGGPGQGPAGSEPIHPCPVPSELPCPAWPPASAAASKSSPEAQERLPRLCQLQGSVSGRLTRILQMCRNHWVFIEHSSWFYTVMFKCLGFAFSHFQLKKKEKIVPKGQGGRSLRNGCDLCCAHCHNGAMQHRPLVLLSKP